MTELVLTYVGSVLIAMEFVRKFTHLQALMGMLMGWPISTYLNKKGFEGWYEAYQAHKFGFAFRIVLSLILCIVLLPFLLASYLIWFIILILNSFHNAVNRFYAEGKRRYRPLYITLIDYTLAAWKVYGSKKQLHVNDKKVMSHIEEQKIPILPLIGITLITVAFVMEITK